MQVNTSFKKIIIDSNFALDFKNLPYLDETFNLVVFDPPILKRSGAKNWLKLKNNILSSDWQLDLQKGINESFRVLKPNGTFLFKWNEALINEKEFLNLIPFRSVFTNLDNRKGFKHWLVFLK